jgi:hypothetical protein
MRFRSVADAAGGPHVGACARPSSRAQPRSLRWHGSMTSAACCPRWLHPISTPRARRITRARTGLPAYIQGPHRAASLARATNPIGRDRDSRGLDGIRRELPTPGFRVGARPWMGRPAAIHRVQHLLTRVTVPEGVHRLRLDYEPEGWTDGVRVSYALGRCGWSGRGRGGSVRATATPRRKPHQ